MRTTTIILLLIISIMVSGQDIPNYEQIAFDYYRDVILNENPYEKKRVTLWAELENEHFVFWFPRCIEDFKLIKDGSLVRNVSKSKIIDTKGDKRFKVKTQGHGGYPRVFVTTSFSNRDNETIVTIVEINKWDGATYHIQMDNNGQVKNGAGVGGLCRMASCHQCPPQTN